MNNEIMILAATAASIGFFHTLFGPDHYLPFIVMSKARGWSMLKTTVITFFCGVGHIMSSVVLGLIGVALGIAVTGLESFEAARGSIASWLLIAFGLAYSAWGIRQAVKNKSHRHIHSHGEDDEHIHEHTHNGEHAHLHEKTGRKSITPWVLFVIFVMGPCEPLIPLLMYPAAKSSVSGLLFVTAVFGLCTLGTMMTMVVIGSRGFKFVPFGRMERYVHAAAGLAILLCGLAMVFLGL